MEYINQEIKLFDNNSLESHFKGKLDKIGQRIKELNDGETLEIANRIEPVVNKIFKENEIQAVNLSFEKDKVKVLPYFVDAIGINAKRVYIKYSIPIEGNRELLKMSISSIPRTFKIPATISNFVLNFSADTGYHNSLELPENVKREVNQKALNYRDFIQSYVAKITEEVKKFNSNLEKEIQQLIINRINEAKANKKIKDDLNPF